MTRLGTIPASATESEEVASFQFLELTTADGAVVYRLTNYPGGTAFDFGEGSESWDDSLGLEMGSVSYDKNAVLSTTQVALMNIDYDFTSAAFSHGLRDGSARLWEAYFDPRDVATSLGYAGVFVGVVDDFVLDQHAVLTLIPHLRPWSRSSPPQKIGAICMHRFKGAECAYVGPDNSCSKIRDDCSTKGNILRFGGFDKMPLEEEILRW